MYNDHVKGLNHSLASMAKALLMANRMRINITPEKREFDEYGDVIRNHKEELQLAYHDEQQNLLSQVNPEFYHTIHFHHTQRESKKDELPSVTILPQLPRNKVVVQPKLSVRIVYAFKTNLNKLVHFKRKELSHNATGKRLLS